MPVYNKILIALDLYVDNDVIIGRGAQLVKDNAATLFLLHVIKPLAVAHAVDNVSWGDQIVSLEGSIQKDAERKMVEIGERLSVPASQRLIKQGKPTHEIHQVVDEFGIDCIVMGSHGQSGLQLLLGSTANGVLHGAPCNVFVVRIKNE